MTEKHWRRRDAFIAAHWCISQWCEHSNGTLTIKTKDRIDRPEVNRFLSDYADVFEFVPDRDVFQLISLDEEQ